MKRNICFGVVAFALMFASQALACTDFVVKAKDGTLINGRSMEFAKPMASLAVAHPRGEALQSTAPGGQKGMSWTSKYGYVLITSWGNQGPNDGMNEKGLSLGFLWYPATKFPSVSKDESAKAVEILDAAAWLLGNFATVQEVKDSLGNVVIWGAKNPTLGGVPPLHIALHDAAGKNIVIEFNDGVMNVHDNPIGVLTNEPSFEWQITNLRNYANLTVTDVPPVKINGFTLSSTGHGAGLLGLPGDPTPPSRFVRTVLNTQLSLPAADAVGAVDLAEHILNAVDITKGVDRLNSRTLAGDYTQWAVMKDLTHKIIYYRSYDDLSLKAIDLGKLDLTPGAKVKSISIVGKSGSFKDVTAEMK